MTFQKMRTMAVIQRSAGGKVPPIEGGGCQECQVFYDGCNSLQSREEILTCFVALGCIKVIREQDAESV